VSKRIPLLKEYVISLKSRGVIRDAIVVYDKFALVKCDGSLKLLVKVNEGKGVMIKEIPVSHSDIVHLWILIVFFLNSQQEESDLDLPLCY